MTAATIVENPFSTRFTRPGALPYVFPAGESLDGLLAILAAAAWRGAITGPHGSGKSTLTAALVSALKRAGKRPRVIDLHDGQRRLPPEFTANPQAGDVFVVDGYEQLGFWARRALRRAVNRSGAGLVVTAHEPIRGLPTIFQTTTTPAAAMALLRQLTRDTGDAAIRNDDVDRLFELHGGNVRELFFALYDLYALRRS